MAALEVIEQPPQRSLDADGTNPTDVVTDTPAAERWELSPDWGPKRATKR